MTQTNVPRDEVEAALLTRRELGPDYEPAIVDSLVERIDQAVAYRVQQELQQRRPPAPAPEPEPTPSRNGHSNRSLALAITSVLVAVPVSAAAASVDGIGWLFAIAILGFVLMINVVYVNGGPRR
ncbi:hypothetical protein [Tenggerimyces flavus]|uniref:DivIVA domain-containing protein n=1 Tax=Tenggerimyces flavus TaxID=1708749 RepID=A0ABV7YLK8_9ACTN|nr:hypothetical protein [Tenggerimyces flavus]MBM7787594.1 hypothetical protein [Tenggerimyces flavus]